MSIKWIIPVLAFIFIFSIPPIFAVDYADHTGYTPKWAKNFDNTSAIDFCGNVTYQGNDFDWCKEFGEYVNNQLTSQQTILVKTDSSFYELDKIGKIKISGNLKSASIKQNSNTVKIFVLDEKLQVAKPTIESNIDYNGNFYLEIDYGPGTFEPNSQYVIQASYDEGRVKGQTVFNTGEKKLPTPDIPAPSVTAVENQASQKELVPVWMKSSAKWWSDKSISDSEFIASIEHMIKIRKIKVSDVSQPVSNSSDSIPDWIRNSAKWWSEDKITDADFIKGIEYLIKSGIIVMPTPIDEIRPQMLLLSASDIGNEWSEDGELDLKDNSATLHFKKDLKKLSMWITKLEFGGYGIFDSIEPLENLEKITYSHDGLKCMSMITHDKAPSGETMCSDGKFMFSIITTDDSGIEFLLMDKMLEKYYNKIGNDFNFSILELSKNPDKIIPIAEPTYEEKIDSLFVVDVIDCGGRSSDKYVEWKGSITSYASEKLDVIIILTGEDSDNKIVTFEKEYVLDLYPEQTKYINRLLTDAPGFDSCSYKIESIR